MNPKDKTREVLLKYYEEYGLEQTVSTALLMLKDNPKSKENRMVVPHVRGELGEVVLECAIMDAIRNSKLKSDEWRLEKSIILKDVDSNNKDYYTELDMVLFTPFKIIAFESKAYQGNKSLTGKGTLKVNGHKFDVYKQHSQHMRVLMTNFDPFIKSGSAVGEAYKMYMFNFSNGTIEDKRITSYKVMLPLIGYKDIPGIINSLGGIKLWNMKLVCSALDLIVKNSDKNHEKHMSYVRGLNHGAR